MTDYHYECFCGHDETVHTDPGALGNRGCTECECRVYATKASHPIERRPDRR